MKSLRFFFLMVFSLFIQVSAEAQENLQFTTLTTQNGLSSNSIGWVGQDKYGYLWVIAGNELNRYDGTTFKVYKHNPDDSTSVISGVLNEIYLDRNQDLWIIGMNGIAHYNYLTDDFTNYPVGPVFQLRQDAKSRYWIAKMEGNFSFNPISGQVSPIKLWVDSTVVKSTRLGAIDELGDGHLLVFQNRMGLFEYDHDEDLFKKVDWKNKELLEEEEFILYMTDDTLGNIWLMGGHLYRYDSEKNSVNIFDLEVTDNWITPIEKDEKGNIWIQKMKENRTIFYRLNPYSGDYSIIDNQNGLNDFRYSNFFTDKSGLYWLSGSNKGLFKADPSIEPIEILRTGLSPDFSLTNDSIRYIYPSPFNPDVLWIGTYNYGLYRYSESTRSAEKIPLEFTMPKDNGSWNFVNGIYEDENYIWCGLAWVGLCRLDKVKGKTKVYSNNNQSSDAVLPMNINKIVGDKEGNLWMAGNGGLSFFNVEEEKFTNYYPPQSMMYSNEMTEMFAEFEAENSADYGIQGAGDNVKYREEFELTSASRFLVQCTGELWIWQNGSFNDYGWIENSEGDTLWSLTDLLTSRAIGTLYRTKLDVITLKPGSYTINFTSDIKGSASSLAALIPGAEKRYGIQLFNLSYDTFNEFKNRLEIENNQHPLSSFVLHDLMLDDDDLWISSNNGINRLELSTGKISYFQNSSLTGFSTDENVFYELLRYNDSLFWVGTESLGLALFNKNNGSIIQYTYQDGLVSNTVFSMVNDQLGNLWLGTENGISKLINPDNPNPPRFINYDTRDGLITNSFNRGCAAISASGRLYFGSMEGINSLLPTSVNSDKPIVALTKFFIRNQEILPTTVDSPLKQRIIDTESLTLSYEQNSFGFEFTTFHFSRPDKNKSAYMLEGFDEDWVYDNSHKASYTNIDPGSYVFRIKGSNGDGFWNEEGKSIRITILKPWYKTWWAVILYAVTFLILVFLIDRVQKKRVIAREREKMRQKDLDQAEEIRKAYQELKLTQQQLIQSEKMASLGELTAGIAHEIQNPLNFVNNFSELNGDLLGELKEEIDKGDLEAIKEIAANLEQNEEKISHHGKRAASIIKGMLQHSHSGSGQKELININSLADEYLRLAYHGLRAKDKSFQADFRIEADDNLPEIEGVAQDLGRVLLNLINNAFYAVSEKGKEGHANYKPAVVVRTSLKENAVEIAVKDNGNGIQESVKQKIFQPFFTTKPTGQGTGLGLSMSYDIITKGHGGEILLETTEGEGTEFIIRLKTRNA